MIEPGIAILISAAFGATGWFINARASLRSVRKQHTYRIIFDYINDEDFRATLDVVKGLRIFSEEKLDLSAISEGDKKRIYKFLNHFEFISAAIWSGDLDENLVRRVEYSRIVRTSQRLKAFIEANRADFNQPTLWLETERLVLRWTANRRVSPAHKLREWLLQKPIPVE